MGRRASRETSMKLLYQLDLQKEDKQEQIDEVLQEEGIDEKDKEYILDIIEGVNNNKEAIDNLIELGLKGWKIDRISKVELAILRLALYEMKYRDDIPAKVSFNEAIELTKKYVGSDKTAFINGLLGKYINESKE